MNLKDVTPKDLACGFGACPKLLQTDDGRIIVIGTVITCEELGEHADGIGPGEQAVAVSVKMLRKAFGPKE